MESIRININKQLTSEGLLPIFSYPAEAAYDFRIHGCAQDMANLGATRAYELRVYPDGRNMQVALVDTIEGGYVQYAILIDTSKVMVPADNLIQALRDLSKTYMKLAVNDDKPSTNKPFVNSVADIRAKLGLNTKAGLPQLLPTPEKDQQERLTYFMNFKSDGELVSLLNYPDQDFFHSTSSIYLLPDGTQPATSPSLRRVEGFVLRVFKILAPDGYEYGEVREGDTVSVNLRGKEGMLPMTIDVKGDVTKPTKYGYFDSASNSIRIDERTIKFYYELRFLVHLNGRMLRSCTVRYNGEQVMPDTNGCYLIKVYEDRLQNAGFIQFTGNNLKDADILVTPGIVKQGEYVFTPEPKHDLTTVTLDFGDGRPIKTTFDVGTDDRLFNHLQEGKLKGYKVKKTGDEYKMFIPRKLTPTSKNILRMMKGLMMVAATFILYALACHIATNRWPWPLQQAVHNLQLHETDDEELLDESPDSAAFGNSDEEDGVIIDENDQVKLEQRDIAYLKANNVWRKDSIRSTKYTAIINTIYNGRISEIKMRGYDSKVINNGWWEQIWRNIIMPSSIKHDVAKVVFEEAVTDNNTLDVVKLYEELSKKLVPSPDGLKSTIPTGPSHSNQVVPNPAIPQGKAPASGVQQGVKSSAPQQGVQPAVPAKPNAATQKGVTPQAKNIYGTKKPAASVAAKTAGKTVPITPSKKKRGY